MTFVCSPRMPTFSDPGLQSVFEIQNFTAVPTVSTSSNNNSSSPSATAAALQNTSSSSSNAGAIAGGVVGGIAGFAAIAALAWFFLRRRNPRQETTGHPAYEVEAGHNEKHELPDTGAAFEMPAPGSGDRDVKERIEEQNRPRYEMA